MTYHQDSPLNIDTPENVTFAYDVAGIGSRFMAAVVDTLIIILGQLIIGLLAMALSSSNPFEDLQSIDEVSPWFFAILGLISFLIYWGYYIFFEMVWNGQSLGKRLVKLRVVRIDGTPITLTESFIRNIVRIVDIIPFNYAVGIIVMFTNNQSRRLGDLAAGTLVIRDKQQEINLDYLNENLTKSGDMVDRVVVEIPFVNGFGPLPVEKLIDSDIQLVKDFLSRRKEQMNLYLLGSKILNGLLNRMEIPASEVEVDFQNSASLLQQIVDYYEYINKSIG